MIGLGGWIGRTIGGYSGTSGWLARDRKTLAPVMVTAAHVVTTLGLLPPGTLAYADGHGLVGGVCRDASPGHDAACVTVLPGVYANEWRTPNMGDWPYGGVRSRQPSPGHLVWKAGHTTGGTIGVVREHDLTVIFDPNNSGKPTAFFGLSAVTDRPGDPPFCAPGDSGAAVVDAFNRVCGLLVARSAFASESYYLPAAVALHALNLVPY